MDVVGRVGWGVVGWGPVSIRIETDERAYR